MNKFYITNAIPYVNAAPHVGHALEFVQSDVIARFHKLIGDDVLLLCGGDENALKNVQAAETAGEKVQDFVDKNTQAFYDLSKKLNIEFDVWQKGSDIKNHYPSSQKLWELCNKSGDIYRQIYKGLYCVGCEAFYTKDELDENGECFEHPGKKLEEVEEENYFFKLSKYQDKLLELIESDTYKITPEFRKNEILNIIKSGLRDFSISRSNVRAKNWGVPVPGDNSQRMYVWFDALNIYQSGIGFGWDDTTYKKWWPANLHVIGKGIIRFHAIYWPAILLSAGLALPKALFVHEYFTVNGQKMSKTLGNVIDPVELINKYGADALRYYFLAKFSPFSDGDFSESKFREVYNADLANGLGNLVARVAKLSESCNISLGESTADYDQKFKDYLKIYEFDKAIGYVWEMIKTLDKDINVQEPWKIENFDEKQDVVAGFAARVYWIGFYLQPFLPETSGKIIKQFSGIIKSGESLFPRLT